MEPDFASDSFQGLESEDPPSWTKYHVCVIGAGISGLRCADLLLQHNIQVTILEARDRIGGRVGVPRCQQCILDLIELRFIRVISWDT